MAKNWTAPHVLPKPEAMGYRLDRQMFMMR
jgi:hypothetical protein